MTMDTASEPSNTAPLNADSAADAFTNLFNAPAEEQKKPEALEADALEQAAIDAARESEADPEKAEEQVEPGDSKVTIEVDGKTVELTKAELADAYKNGLRQADYTKKTMEAAEVRKTAEAETVRARQERDHYAQGLTKNAMQLEAVLEQSKQIDWDALISADPVEAMKQQHLLQKRQAAYQETLQQLQAIDAQTKAEQAEQMNVHRKAQQDQLLAKLPDWKDASKAKAEAAQIREYLQTQGYEAAELDNISDHRAVLLGRKAMKFDQMMDKAKAATKQVQTLPQKVLRPGVGDTPNLDRRSSAMQRLNKTGRVEDAAALFTSFL